MHEVHNMYMYMTRLWHLRGHKNYMYTTCAASGGGGGGGGGAMKQFTYMYKQMYDTYTILYCTPFSKVQNSGLEPTMYMYQTTQSRSVCSATEAANTHYNIIPTCTCTCTQKSSCTCNTLDIIYTCTLVLVEAVGGLTIVLGG